MNLTENSLKQLEETAALKLRTKYSTKKNSLIAPLFIMKKTCRINTFNKSISLQVL